jgi:hypothetical protein
MTSVSGNGGVIASTQNFGINGNVVVLPTNLSALATAITLPSNTNGIIFSVPTQGANATITLPPAASSAGFNCKFMVRASIAPTAALTQLGAILTITGGVGAGAIAVYLLNNATPTGGAATLYTSLNFTAAAYPGDSIELTCDGNKYYAVARSSNAAGVAATV